jgi:hypothetical protein
VEKHFINSNKNIHRLTLSGFITLKPQIPYGI